MALGKSHHLLLLIVLSAFCLGVEDSNADSTEEIPDDDFDSILADVELAYHTVEVVPGLMDDQMDKCPSILLALN